MKKYTIKEQVKKNEKRNYKSPSDIEYHRICEGKCTLYKRENSEFYYYRFYLSNDKKYLKRSTKTADLELAKSIASEDFYTIQRDLRNGVRYFGMTILECADLYMQDRYAETRRTNPDITLERYQTVRTQVTKHIIPFMMQKYDKDFRMKNLKKDDFYDYEDYRFNKTNGKVAKVTIRNEQTTITHFVNYCYVKDYTDTAKVFFKKIVIRDTDIGRRDTFEFPDEYRYFTTKQRAWVKNAKDDYTEYYRSQIRDFNLFLANSGLRFREALLLKWASVNVYTKRDERNRELRLIRVKVPKEIAKNRKDREFICLGGNYLDRIKKNSNFTKSDNYIFCQIDKDSPTNKYSMYRYFADLLRFAKLNERENKLSFYSFRHLYITLRIAMQVPIYEISYNAGTDVKFIEKHYSHIRYDMLEKNAMRYLLTFNRDSKILSPESYEETTELENYQPILEKNKTEKPKFKSNYRKK